MTLILLLYNLVLAVLLPPALLFFLIRRLVTGRAFAGATDRLAFRLPPAPPEGPSAIWIHAVSVGEVLAVAPLVERIRRDNRPVSFVWSGFRTGEQIWYFRDTMEPLNLNDTMELSEIFNQDTQYSIRDIASAIRNMMNTPSPTASSRYDTLSSDWIGNTALRIKKNANIADRVTNLSAQLSRVVDKRLIEGLKLPFTRGVDAARVTLEGARYLRTVLYYLHDINRTPSNRVAFVRLRNAMDTLTKEQFLTRNTGWTNKRNCTAVATLFTFCPPGAEARINSNSSSRSSRWRDGVI